MLSTRTSRPRQPGKNPMHTSNPDRKRNPNRLFKSRFPTSSVGPWLSLVARAVGATAFAFAGFAKIGDPQATVRAVRAYRILPEAFVHAVAYALPSFEIVLAVLLVLGVATRVVGLLAAVAVTIFVIAIASAGLRGLRIDCGCFGGGGAVTHTHYLLDIGRDLLLLTVILIVPIVRRSKLAWRLGQPHARALAGGTLALAVIVGIAVNASNGAHRRAAAVGPAGATAAGGIVVGSAAAPVHLIAYEDPQCPVCGQFERINGGTLESAIKQGKVAVEFRMRSFLGIESVRADNALAAAANEGKFEQLREALFAHQPVEKTGGFTTSDLLALGRSVGLTDPAFTNAVRSMTYRVWVEHVDDQASRDGNVGTPQLIKVGSGPLTAAQTFDPAQFATALDLPPR
jgi:protein-disulfide isomerase/uncharacterized membrane protein YphA (DoxX/SURF4 family)